jgi:hypothetical protein
LFTKTDKQATSPLYQQIAQLHAASSSLPTAVIKIKAIGTSLSKYSVLRTHFPPPKAIYYAKFSDIR